MNNKNIILLAACMLTASCTHQGLVVARACATSSIPVSCDNASPNVPKITINRQAKIVTPPNVCAFKGTTVEISLVPVAQNELGNASIVPKESKDTWLVGTNYPDKDKIFIKIPDWVVKGEYNFGAAFSDGSCIDPRIEVTN